MKFGLKVLKNYIVIFFCACCLLPDNLHAQEAGAAGGQAVQSSPAPQQPQSLPVQLPAGMTVESLTPAQRQAVQAEMSKTGGQMTPDAIETLKKSPEFKDLKPEDVQKGKELLEKKEEKKVEEKVDNKGVVQTGKEGNSLFDRYLSTASPLEVSTKLESFGYDLFAGVDLASPKDLPVPADYMVGPGDEINILLWGRMNAQFNLTVSREGTIQFPNIGPLSVGGMTYEEVKRYLTRQAKNIVGAEINVTMGRLRSIQVFVLGETKKPGAYTVSAMSTLTNALMAAGGPTMIGSLRKVELKRNNKNIAAMDFYELLLKGDKSKDLRLQNGDVIFVPTVGPIVGIAGNVKRPAVYELKDDNGLAGVLELAGGIIPTAYTQQIQVERVERYERRIVIDINDRESGAVKNFKLQDADLVKVFSIVGKDANVIYLNGNVKRPGKYEIKKGMRLKDVIKDESELLDKTYFDYALIKRLVPPTLEVKLIPFNLGTLLFKGSQEDNMELVPQDSIFIFPMSFFKDRPTVTIDGEVRKGGKFPLEENLTIKDLVLMAGGLTKDAFYDDLEIYKTDIKTKEVTLYKFSLAKAMDGDEANNVKLQDMDRVVIHSVWENVPKQYLTVSGDVNKPGQFPYAANMTIKDLIFASGNLLESAYLDEAELTSHTVKDGRLSIVSHKKIDMRRVMADDPAHNILLKPYDSLFIRKISEWKTEKYVEIKGEAVFPGRYLIKKGERLSSIIERAGGFTDKAYLKGALFTRVSVRELQQKNLNDALDRLEQQMISQSSMAIQTSLSSEDALQQKAVAEQQKALIAKMRAAKAQGRVVIILDTLDKFRGSTYDIELEGGDLLAIPEKPNSIQIIGSVYNSTAFVFNPKETVSDYIGKSGGTTRYAEEKDIFVLKSDGSAVARRQSGMFFMSSRLDPGDTIVVPEKVERIAWMKEIKDMTQILYQIAVTAGVLIVAF
ncbi:MAG: SLBB domain-containing protein [Deltaproteobacteria bacterium]|nr:SLBB domain-containing protein [Deltaproteobacteria bacterium]